MSALNGDTEIVKIVCNFINECFDKRAKILVQKKEQELLMRPQLTIARSGRNSIRPNELNL